MQSMTKKWVLATVASGALLLSACSSTGDNASAQQKEAGTSDEAELATKASRTLQQDMANKPQARLPKQLVSNARCIAVFPSVVKGALIVGGEHGKGMVSCRQEDGGFNKANPAVFSIDGGSIGLQAGGQKSSVVLLFMTQESVEKLMDAKFQFGGEISATAGPKGYHSQAKNVSAPVVAYAVSQNGLYAGLDLSGKKMSFDEKANQRLYGPSASARGILLGDVKANKAMTPFQTTLQRFAPVSKPAANDDIDSESDQDSNS